MSLPVYQNILSCFDDIITLDSCIDVTPTSGFSMQQIGITKFELGQYINKEYQSGAALFNDKKTFSIRLIANQIHQHLQNKYKAKTLVNSKRVGFINDNKESQPNTGTDWAGQEINLKNNNSFLELFISEISLFTNFTGDIEVRIYDLMTGTILKSESGLDFVFIINSIAGEISVVYPQIKIQSPKRGLNLALIYNSTGIVPYKLTTIESGCVSCDPCSHTRHSDVWGITIPNASNIIKSSITHTQYTGGMSVVYSINCSYDKWLCSISNLIALPLLYKTASEIMDYALNNSDQINSKTFGELNYEKIKERRESYEFKYREAMDNILSNIVLPNDNVCFQCEQNIIRTTAIP